MSKLHFAGSFCAFRVLPLTAAVLFGFAASGRAQAPPGVPGIPATPTAPAVAGAPAAATGAAPAAPAAPSNLWSFLCPTADQKAACQAKLCALPITQLLNNMMMPVSLFSGGLFSGCCPTGPSAADLAAPADSADGAAARIKQSEAEAKKRRADMRYLGTVDCRYWPEAEAALINGLRSDPNECVRYEAAHALANGCCCTKAIIDALVLCVSGSTKDHHPAEMSQRVRNQAGMALERCLCRYSQVVGAPDSNQRPEKPEKVPPPATLPAPQVLPTGYVPVATPLVPVPNAGAESNGVAVTGQRSLYEVLTRSTSSTTTPAVETAPPPLAPVAAPAKSTESRDLFTIMRNSLSAGQ